jgi:hypothetical protein
MGMMIDRLYNDMIEAERAWERAIEQAGVYRYSPESSQGQFADLYQARAKAIESYRQAAFPHASK